MDELEALPLRDPHLLPLHRLALEFHHALASDADEMVVVFSADHRLEPSLTSEVPLLHQPGVDHELERAVDRDAAYARGMSLQSFV